MKKTVIYLFSILIVSATLSSCAKTNARKLSGDWTISSLSDVSTTINNNGTSTTTVTINGTTLTVNDEDPNGSNISTGLVNSASITFEKDGTWSRTLSYTIDFSGTGFTASVTNATNDSGTWSFVGKNKSAELKANDRIVLSTLSSTGVETTSYTMAGVTTNEENNSSNTYSEGENTETLLVESSTKSELIVSANENNVSTYIGETTINTKVASWTLTK